MIEKNQTKYTVRDSSNEWKTEIIYIVGSTLRYEMMNYKAIPVGIWWYWVSVWLYWLVFGGTGSIEGSAGDQ